MAVLQKVTFQMSVVSDGFSSYGLVTYAANGTQVDRSMGRPVTIGYLSTNLEMASPDTDTGNTGHTGVWFYRLSTEVTNFAQRCLNWFYGHLPLVTHYRWARFDLAACPCLRSVAEVSSALLAEQVTGDVACYLSAPVSPDQHYAQRCCYNQTTGSFLQTIPFAGSFLRFHPRVHARGHYEMDTLPKQHCCNHSRLCDLYYRVRPISTCQHISLRQEHTRFLDFGSQQGDSTLPKGQQRLSAKVNVPSGLPIAGKIVTKAFVSMNGLISFGKKYDSFSARRLPVPGFDLMCGYWTDLQLPTADTTANVWYQVYRRNENSTARDLTMLTTGGKKVELYAHVSSYLPVFMLVATFQHVPLDGASTDRTELLFIPTHPSWC